jgi:hypothetical protein
MPFLTVAKWQKGTVRERSCAGTLIDDASSESVRWKERTFLGGNASQRDRGDCVGTRGGLAENMRRVPFLVFDIYNTIGTKMAPGNGPKKEG